MTNEADSERDSPRLNSLHPKLKELFDALNQNGMEWLLLRGADRLERPLGDVDLLVSRRSLSDLDLIVRSHAFLRISSAVLSTRRGYVLYDHLSNLWIKLDVVCDIAFGPVHDLMSPLGSGILQRRKLVGYLWLPDSDDAFWHLLLHFGFDKGSLSSAHISVLAASLKDARVDGEFGRFLSSVASETVLSRLLEAVGATDVESANVALDSLRQAWISQENILSRVSAMIRRALSRLNLGTWTSLRPGAAVAVLGPDGAGKTTLAQGLCESFAIPTTYEYMGLWKETRWMKRIARVPGASVPFVLGRMLARRSRVTYLRLRGRIVIMDRYHYDAYLVPRSAAWRQRITARLVLMLGQPADMILILDLPGEIAFSRKGEQSVEELNQWRESYLSLTTHQVPNSIIDATQSASLVHQDASQAIWEFVSLRRRQRQH